MRKVGRSAAEVLARLCELVKPGMSTLEIDEAGGEIMKEIGVKSACKGYRSGHRIFPSYTCLSVNEEVVHGIGIEECILQEGDVLSVDVCVKQDGFIGDNCRTVPVGEVTPEVARLLRVTEQSLYLGLINALHKLPRRLSPLNLVLGITVSHIASRMPTPFGSIADDD